MNNTFDTVADIIRHRRTIKFAAMSGDKAEDHQIEQLLELADAAPTHGRTEPWRFRVYADEGFKRFNQEHAQMYWEHTPEEVRNPNTKSAIESYHDKASHLIVAIMKRTPQTKFPVMEEIAAAAAAVQNILIGAQAMGLATFWNTGAMVLKPAMKSYLQLEEEDMVLGFIYVGIPNAAEAFPPVRIKPLSDKTEWFR